MISKARKTLKEYCNQKDILEIAEKFLTGKEEIKNLDDDWLSFFMDKAKNINNDDIKLMFGKILAGRHQEKRTFLKTDSNIRNYGRVRCKEF